MGWVAANKCGKINKVQPQNKRLCLGRCWCEGRAHRRNTPSRFVSDEASCWCLSSRQGKGRKEGKLAVRSVITVMPKNKWQDISSVNYGVRVKIGTLPGGRGVPWEGAQSPSSQSWSTGSPGWHLSRWEGMLEVGLPNLVRKRNTPRQQLTETVHWVTFE